MFTILLHSSKTMRTPDGTSKSYQVPALIDEATELSRYLTTLTPAEIKKSMQLSAPMAEKTLGLLSAWTTEASLQRPAIDAFLGDIYSGLQVQTLSDSDRAYANKCLFILSGLYGVLHALDGIHPYRLEMGYRLPDAKYHNLLTFWGDKIASCLPSNHTIVNLSAVEYTKAVLPYLPNVPVIAPKFMTEDPTTHEAKFVVVHAKIARGAFARWMIVNRIESVDDLAKFNDLGYSYNAELSTPEQPVFVCKQFDGIGLSVRLT